MMVCSQCTHHLAPITLSLTKGEMKALQNAPMSRHLHGTTITDGVSQDIVIDTPLMPYGFKKGRPQYPSAQVLRNAGVSEPKDFR
jgi:hypothetical protein